MSEGQILQWSEYLDPVVHCMNTREVRVHGFTRADLLFQYNPVRHHHEFTVRDHQAAQELQDRHHPWDNREDEDFLGPQQDVHLAGWDEYMEDARQRYLTRFAEHRGRKGQFPAPKEGPDLVLLQCAALNNRYDKKLEACWEGPFHLDDLAHHRRSGRLYDITTGALVKTKPSGLEDRIHLDDLKVYVPRAEQGSKEGEGDGVLECVRMGG